MRNILIATLFLLACATVSGERTEHAAARGLQYDRIDYAGVEYAVVRVRPDEADLRLFWKDDDGRAYENFENLRAGLAKKGQQLLFAMNSGIYAEDNTPLGLHVQDGKELRPLNRDNGQGNFFLQPNGVFYVSSRKARVLDTKAYAEENPQPTLATQSGPMLIDNNEVNPQFSRTSTSGNLRNGVGILENNEIVFVLSLQPVNLYAFADFFRSKLGCANALYLDGAISKMYIPFGGRVPKKKGNFVGMLGVVAPLVPIK